MTATSCVCGTALTERDATFAVSHENRVRVYASSELYLLHEFSSIHGRILRLFHTTFCDALVTLETDVGDSSDCYLCVYHDWRAPSLDARKLVRAYTLPLAIDDPRAVCLSVCAFTGRVALTTPSSPGLNLWQTSDGFFEHVMELSIDMAISHVAVHGAYVAVASPTEVRVLEVQVVTDPSATPSTAPTSKMVYQKKELIYNTLEKDHLPTIRIPSLSGRSPAPLPSPTPRHRVRVMAKDDATLEAYNLAGLVRDEDVRVNAAMEYVQCHAKVLLQRFVPPNHAIDALRFLPETIANGRLAQSQSYARLLVGTSAEAFLYYLLADQVDTTRDQMSKKILQRAEDPLRGIVEPIAITANGQSSSFTSRRRPTESGRVVMCYRFTAPVACITANSSFLFAATLGGLEVWSLWSPCQHPSSPQLLGVRPLPSPAHAIVALDAHVVVLTCPPGTLHTRYLSRASAAPMHSVPLELRSHARRHDAIGDGQVFVYPQSPPATIFASAKAATLGDHVSADQVDLLLSLFSLYRFRADVSLGVLTGSSNSLSPKEAAAVRLEAKLYDGLARACAAHIAHLYTAPLHRNLTRAALLYVASNVSSRDVLLRFRSIDDADADVIDATALYLEAFLFPKKDPALYLGLTTPVLSETESADPTFTSVVLRHYGDGAPEQLARLVIDSSLVWSLMDLDFCLHVLRGARHKTVLLRVAMLVAIVRANRGAREEVAAFVDAKAAYLPGANAYSYETLADQVGWLAENYPDPLVHLCVTHPEFLVQKHPTSLDEAAIAPGYYRSWLADALRERAPLKLLSALELIVHSALGHGNAFPTVATFALGVLGEPGVRASQRIVHGRAHMVAAFASDEELVLATLHFMLVHLRAHDGPLAPVAKELLVCIARLSASGDGAQAAVAKTLSTRASLLPQKLAQPLPAFVAPFLAVAMSPDALPHVQQTLQTLYLLACHLVRDAVVEPNDVLSDVETTVQSPMAVLLQLLLLPLVGRLGDGLALLAATTAYQSLLVPYAVAYCTTLAEWAMLLDLLFPPEMASVLDEALSHLSVTLTPDDLLMLLPDTLPADVVLAALETSVRRAAHAA
ncbi:hypothetical protein SPRG_09201 [Saprolegnia parasitica CBS 223.65]|uniref:BLOC-2 complex member HPS3 N-terminal domain-containing protein n=1 Tax=Saprolegnia parasitica (strain CBS 223.65) TaxID=695850 RepID=A0A067CE17_SAPPC|nr:hypothetical protein SPRG_09201 [Saprolegnia parasitica CBS 223.65]KDO25062.1 hypothetical protein SPRG_09201 [Saprolegnia parasitica CBS 223.65]|eukprot:XP_012204137.1 hypothetical protein SPRG_09201 [Saprolegnia parasitica CBS 223.65]